MQRRDGRTHGVQETGTLTGAMGDRGAGLGKRKKKKIKVSEDSLKSVCTETWWGRRVPAHFPSKDAASAHKDIAGVRAERTGGASPQGQGREKSKPDDSVSSQPSLTADGTSHHLRLAATVGATVPLGTQLWVFGHRVGGSNKLPATLLLDRRDLACLRQRAGTRAGVYAASPGTFEPR